MWRGDAEVDSLNRLVIFGGLVLAAGPHPARLSQVSDAGLDAVHRGVPQRRARREPAHRASARRSCSRRSSIRSGSAADRRGASSASRSRRTSARSRRWTRTRSSDRCSARSRRRCARTPTCPTRPALAFKLRSADVPEMPKPFPLFEIFVYSSQMEAIHLRGGMVARGGIRWSDRKEDYRTEVLGLMKAQTREERGDRARRLEGRIHPEALDELAGGAETGGRDPVRHVHARLARHHRQPRAR